MASEYKNSFVVPTSDRCDLTRKLQYRNRRRMVEAAHTAWNGEERAESAQQLSEIRAVPNMPSGNFGAESDADSGLENDHQTSGSPSLSSRAYLNTPKQRHLQAQNVQMQSSQPLAIPSLDLDALSPSPLAMLGDAHCCLTYGKAVPMVPCRSLVLCHPVNDNHRSCNIHSAANIGAQTLHTGSASGNFTRSTQTSGKPLGVESQLDPACSSHAPLDGYPKTQGRWENQLRKSRSAEKHRSASKHRFRSPFAQYAAGAEELCIGAKRTFNVTANAREVHGSALKAARVRKEQRQVKPIPPQLSTPLSRK